MASASDRAAGRHWWRSPVAACRGPSRILASSSSARAADWSSAWRIWVIHPARMRCSAASAVSIASMASEAQRRAKASGSRLASQMARHGPRFSTAVRVTDQSASKGSGRSGGREAANAGHPAVRRAVARGVLAVFHADGDPGQRARVPAGGDDLVDAAACSSARSPSTATKAFTTGLSSAICNSVCSVSSRADTSASRTLRAREPTDVRRKSTASGYHGSPRTWGADGPVGPKARDCSPLGYSPSS